MNTPAPTRRSRRRTAVLLGGLAAGGVLALAAPLAASAHVHVDPSTAEAGAAQALTFTFSHGCDGSPTTAVVIDIPDGAATTTPVAQGGWAIQRTLGADEQPTQVTFTPESPIESGIQASVALVVTFSEDAAHTDVAFPVTQQCVTGSTAWTQVAEEGVDPETLDSPAPIVAVGDVADSAEHGHAGSHADSTAGSTAGSASGSSDHGDDTGTTAAAATTSPAADPVARWLAGAGLVAGLAALAVVLVRGRRRA